MYLTLTPINVYSANKNINFEINPGLGPRAETILPINLKICYTGFPDNISN